MPRPSNLSRGLYRLSSRGLMSGCFCASSF
nr:MAG TPA: hypothetical protein [Caudoviricetes sp.]